MKKIIVILAVFALSTLWGQKEIPANVGDGEETIKLFILTFLSSIIFLRFDRVKSSIRLERTTSSLVPISSSVITNLIVLLTI